MQVTDDMLRVAIEAYKQSLEENCYGGQLLIYGKPIKAALQAVFDHIADADKKVSMPENPTGLLKVVKDFVDMMEKSLKDNNLLLEQQNSTNYFMGYCSAYEEACGEKEYEALKALVDKPKEDYSSDEYTIMGLQAELDMLVEQIFSAKDLDRLKEVTKLNFPEEWKEFEFCADSAEDGWIEWHEGMSVNESMEFKRRDGTIFKYSPIIAYRVIQPKEESKFTKPVERWEFNSKDSFVNIDGKTYKLTEYPEKKEEPKKQTLLEYAEMKYILGGRKGYFYKALKIISDYLEERLTNNQDVVK